MLEEDDIILFSEKEMKIIPFFIILMKCSFQLITKIKELLASKILLEEINFNENLDIIINNSKQIINQIDNMCCFIYEGDLLSFQKNLNNLVELNLQLIQLTLKLNNEMKKEEFNNKFLYLIEMKFKKTLEEIQAQF